MMTVHAFKAQPVVRAEPVGAVTILIEQEIPEPGTLAEGRAVYEEDGRKLADVLAATLPGGTLDALTVELLRRKATSLVVPRDA